MIESSLAWLPLLLIQLAVSDDSDTCVYKECYCMYTTIFCDNLHLTEIPRANTSNFAGFSALSLTYNAISVIPSKRLPPNMSEIDLQENPIASIDDSAFDESSATLKTLVFSTVLFQKIPNALLQLSALESLSIADSNIPDWNEAVMIHIGTTLLTLNLQNVSLTSWPTWVQQLSNLTDLIIVSCLLTSIPDSGLDNVVHSLTTLSLASNRLTEVPKALAKLQVLQTLYLDKNSIVDVSWLPPKSPLITLWLNNNHVNNAETVSNTLRPYGETLMDFEIQDNLLTSIPNCSFLIHIGELDFSHNKISNPYAGSLYLNISTLDLSYNALQTIPPVMTTLRQMNMLLLPYNNIKVLTSTYIPTWVTELEFGFNLISQLTDNSFPLDSQIVTLHFNNNPIIRISDLAFRNVPLLRELNLQGTKLNRLPLALGSLSGLTYFDMSNIEELVCTCMEKSLQKWIQSQTPESVVGDCGRTSIYDFFSQLSSDCP